MSEQLGRYEILEELGQGGFAIVHRGRDTALDREVALKELRPVLLRDEGWVNNFRHEARTIAQLDHPHIVSIYDIYEATQRIFIVMRLVQGPSLENLIVNQNRLSWEETVALISTIATALDYAHSHQVLHRDLKPANILIDAERGPMLTDFGLARLTTEHSQGVTADSVVGTPNYIAPEVWEGQAATAQSDIYALGCVLFEMLTGQKMFQGATPLAVMKSHFSPPRLPTQWPADVPPYVHTILAKALAKDPAGRWKNATSLANAMAELALPTATTASLPAQSRRRKPLSNGNDTGGLRVNSPILATKLYSSLNRVNLIARPRLTRRLTEGVAAGGKLVLISAPAGFGKSTLVSSWLRSQRQQPANSTPSGLKPAPHLKSAWLSLDEGDNDPVRFLFYLIAALQTLEPHLADSILQTPQLPPPQTLATLLINELTSLPDPFALVLDDYHLISSGHIHQTIEFLVEHQPPHMHLIITTREDPPLPLGRLRAGGHIVEIRQDDLRFTAQEAAAFLNEAMGLSLTPKTVQALENRTEGWIAGLQLAALSLQGRDAPHVADFIEAFSGSHRYVIDYLLEEVIYQQPRNIRQFLRETSILDRFSAPLCNAVTDQMGGQLVLSYLEQVNLFLIPLDDERKWYRYHHLFAEFLQTEINPAQKKILHRRAAHWFKKNGFLTDAVRHALAAEEFEEAGRLIIQAAERALRVGAFVTLSNWLDAMPSDYVRSNVELANYKGWVAWMTGDTETAESYMASAQQHLPDDAPQALRGKMLSLQACLAITRETNDEDLLRVAKEAIPLLQEETDSFFTGMAMLVLGEAQNYLGDTESAQATLHEAAQLGRKLDDNFLIVGALTNLAQMVNWQGRRRQAEALCHEALAASYDDKGQLRPMGGVSYITLAEVQMYAGDLKSAQENLQRGIELTEKYAMVSFEIYGKLVLGPLQYALNQPEAALQTVHEIVQVIIDSKFDSYMELAQAVEADMRLKLGDIAGLETWAKTVHLPDDKPLSFYKGVEYLANARYLLATHQPDKALNLLKHLEKRATASQRGLILIELYLVQAQALLALNQTEQAKAQLAEAVRRAAPEAYHLMFWFEGAPLVPLLPAVRHIAPDFIDAVQAELVKRYGVQPPSPAVPASAIAASQELIEPLTDREIEVLHLVAAGQSNREAAENLVVTVGTVKKHLSNIFGKLGVNSRTQAIAKGRELGLI